MVQVHVRPTSLHTIHSALIGQRFSHIPTLYMSPSTRSAYFSFIPPPSPHRLNQHRLLVELRFLKMHLWAQPFELF